MICPWPEADDAQLRRRGRGGHGAAHGPDPPDPQRPRRVRRDARQADPGHRGRGAKLEMLEAQRGLLTFLGKVDDEQLTLHRTLDEKPQAGRGAGGRRGCGGLPAPGRSGGPGAGDRPPAEGAGRGGAARSGAPRGCWPTRALPPRRRRTWSSSSGTGWPSSRSGCDAAGSARLRALQDWTAARHGPADTEKARLLSEKPGFFRLRSRS